MRIFRVIPGVLLLGASPAAVPLLAASPAAAPLLAASPAAVRAEAPRLLAPTIPDTPPGPTVAPLKLSEIRRVSPHIWLIPGFPNIPIIVGTRAVLVVDTGLGTTAGALVAREAKRLGGGKPLYVTTTHFHPEHAAGMGGFPPGTPLLRPEIQQRELALDEGRMLARFRTHNAEALAEPDYGTPQLFRDETSLDLGGVTARIFWAGPAHTHGDTLVWVKEDSALISGDTVQSRASPTFLGGGIGPAEWLRTLAPIAALEPGLVIPTHSQPGPGMAMIRDQQAFLQAMIERTARARADGLSEDASVTRVMGELQGQFPDWTLNPLTSTGVRLAWRTPNTPEVPASR